MEKWKKRSVDLITSFALGCSGSPSVVPYYPQKTSVSAAESRYFPRTAPEKYGISSKRLYAMLSELEAEDRACIHNLMILANGEVICECSRDGYDVNIRHLSHSMSKTVAGMAVGMLVDDGVLSTKTRLVKIFPEIPYRDRKFSNITVEHLLTMTSGVDFNEAASVTEDKWTEAFFRSTVKFIPGSKFNYNSMNTYVLVRIVERVSGRKFSDLINERLFAPLGITNYLWEKSAEGFEKGGWGLYLSAESWAKIGYMYMLGGIYLGRRILSEKWVEESIKPKAISSGFNGDFDYGYQLWVDSKRGEVVFNGMLGQNVWICPKNGIVSVVMGGSNELFQETSTQHVIRRYLGSDINDELDRRDLRMLHEKETHFCDHLMRARPKPYRGGFLVKLGLRPARVFDESWTPLLGSFALCKNNVSILPLIVAAMQNNLAAGIDRFSLLREGNELYMEIREGGAVYKLEVGIYEYKTTHLDIRGEKYIVRALGECVRRYDGKNEYRIEIIFPELPNTRSITLTEATDGGLLISFSEMPNNKIIESILNRMSEVSSPIAFGVELVERRFGDGVVSRTLEKTFNPTIMGANMTREDYPDIIKEAERRRYEESVRARLLRAFVDRFFKESEERETSDTLSPRENILKKVIGHIARRRNSIRRKKQ